MSLPPSHPKPKTSMELLAPAGSLQAFEVALAEGADAVYVGAPGFNARSLQKELSYGELAAMVEQAHDRSKRVYIAMNSLIKSHEIGDVLKSLSIFEQIGPDALIIQDLGLFHLVNKHFPSLPLHASTLLTTHNSIGADFLANIGFERVVLARELSLEEIGEIAAKSVAELEIFIHGAMCFSYSGLCLFSTLHGGKSSLRGKCVQPCRRNYQLQERGGKKRGSFKKQSKGHYLFSMNDLSGVDALEQLNKIGIASLKIEGRLKSIEYVRKTVAAYRLLLDNSHLSKSDKQKVYAQARQLLDDSMGRKRSGGFFTPGTSELISPHKSGVGGIFLGKAEKKSYHDPRKKEAGFQVVLKHGLESGDRVRFQDQSNDIRVGFTVKKLKLQKNSIDKAKKGQRVTITVPGITFEKKGNVQGLFFLVDTKKRRKKEGLARDKIFAQKQIQPDFQKIKLINKDYGFGDQPLPGKIGFSASSTKRNSTHGSKQVNWWIRLDTIPPPYQKYPVPVNKLLVPLVKRNFEKIISFGKGASTKYRKLIWELPSIIHQHDLKWYFAVIKELSSMGFVAYQISHVSQQLLFDENSAVNFSLYGNYTLNTLNASTMEALQGMGLQGVLFSLETDRENLQQSIKESSHRLTAPKSGQKNKILTGMYVFGKPPLFTSRIPTFNLKASKKIVSPRNEHFVFEHEENMTKVYADVFFFLLPYVHEMQRFGVDYFILDIGRDSFHKASFVLKDFFYKRKEPTDILEGNYNGGLM